MSISALKSAPIDLIFKPLYPGYHRCQIQPNAHPSTSHRLIVSSSRHRSLPLLRGDAIVLLSRAPKELLLRFNELLIAHPTLLNLRLFPLPRLHLH